MTEEEKTKTTEEIEIPLNEELVNHCNALFEQDNPGVIVDAYKMVSVVAMLMTDDPLGELARMIAYGIVRFLEICGVTPEQIEAHQLDVVGVYRYFLPIFGDRKKEILERIRDATETGDSKG